MTAIIQHIGSHWAGEDQDTVQQLLDMLANHPLDRKFENFGNFIEFSPVCITSLGTGPDGIHTYAESEDQPYKGLTSFWGNFFDWSYVFHIHTDEPGLIATLTEAIRTNQQRPDYLAQPFHPDHAKDIIFMRDGTRKYTGMTPEEIAEWESREAPGTDT